MRAQVALLVFSGALAAIGCDDDRVYVGDDKLYQVALTPMTAPVVMTEEGGLYIVETHAEVPIRQPNGTELGDLRDGVRQYKNLPFSRLPWVERGEIELQLDFTLTNLDAQRREIAVVVNGMNEFFEYVPGILIDEEEVTPLHAQWERAYSLGPKERLTRTVREEEFDEVAVDLATVVNGAPNSDEVVYFENKSNSDPRSMKYIPEVIPGLTGIRLGLRSTTAATILLEATLRVRDVGEKLASGDDKRMRIMPQQFESVVPEN